MILLVLCIVRLSDSKISRDPQILTSFNKTPTRPSTADDLSRSGSEGHQTMAKANGTDETAPASFAGSTPGGRFTKSLIFPVVSL
jgi:hypothetical protein